MSILLSEDFDFFPVPLVGDAGPLKTHLRRFGKAKKNGAPAVVLLHGGNSSGDAFRVPEGGLVSYLAERKLDVWILEWRSSPDVLGRLLRPPVSLPLGGSVSAERRLFTLDHVVEEELPNALTIVRREIGDAELSMLGHCLGSAVTSIATARGVLEPFRVSNLVLSTLGLFVEVPWNGWLKAEDFIMERVLHNDPTCRAIDPHSLDGWATEMKSALQHWPSAWLPGGKSPGETFLRRLSFMFGQPYAIDRLHPSLRGEEVLRFFGPMHVGLFLHASQMVRRGFAARFDAPDVMDRPRLPAVLLDQGFKSDLVNTYFLNKRVTLLAAGANHLWHRESIDLMYEWLKSNGHGRSPSACTKTVFPGYNLQELMWGERARQEVFPVIADGIMQQRVRAKAPPAMGKSPAASTVRAITVP